MYKASPLSPTRSINSTFAEMSPVCRASMMAPSIITITVRWSFKSGSICAWVCIVPQNAPANATKMSPTNKRFIILLRIRSFN
jgi:hypothetical protein